MPDHMCKMLSAYKRYNSKMSATKRIPVSEHIWTLLYDLKKPGQTYDSLIEELVHHEKELRFLSEMDAIESEADFSELNL